MNRSESLYRRHRFPAEIIQQAVWLYHRFNLSACDIEDLLAERGIAVSYESIRLWCIKFGSKYTKRLRRRHQGYGDTFFIDEVFVKIQGKQHYLWRAVDQDGEVVDVFLQARRDGKTAMRFFKSMHQAQRFLSAHAALHNLFNLGRHLISAKHYRLFRQRAFASWKCATAT
jgi:putative transposase